MKIAISSSDQNIQSEVSEFFGRSPYFLIVQIQKEQIKDVQNIKNKALEQTSGIGISSAQLLAEQDVEAVISGNIGPRALDVLNQFKIKAYLAQGKAEEAVQKFIQGKLEEIN